MSKKKDRIKIKFIGNNADNVAGSMILVETPNKKILLECGMIQGGSIIDDYRENSKPFTFKARDIQYVFVNHAHADHIARIPKLFRDGFDGKIITTEITKQIAKPMLLDSANIIRKDAEYISKKKGKAIYPYYIEDDVHGILNMIETYDLDIVYNLDDEISFRFLKNSHIVGACQLELFIKDESGFVNKILYTSDMGSVKPLNYYVDNFEKCKTANIIISESTYGGAEKGIKPDRKKDLEKIKTTIEQVCNIQKGRILIPVFSLSRCQQILTDLYMLYKDDPTFKTPIFVDSPLIWEINKVYENVLRGDNLELFKSVCAWKNVMFIRDYKESQINVKNECPKIVLSSSGFLSKGRSVTYISEYIKHPKDAVIICGYCPPNSIGGKIKSGQKSVTIDGVTYKNKCGITTLSSYSSHIQQSELINYLKGISADRIYLVHGEMEKKNELKQLLEKEISKLNKTTKIICTNKGTVCNL